MGDSRLLLINRFLYSPLGVFGRLSWIGSGLSIYTLERPWKNNIKNFSCIPVGLYWLKRDNFRGQYENFKLIHVEGRTNIEIHRGNTIQDSNGCILLGKEWRYNSQANTGGVVHSKNAMDEFMREMHGIDEISMLIYNGNLQ